MQPPPEPADCAVPPRVPKPLTFQSDIGPAWADHMTLAGIAAPSANDFTAFL